MLPSLVSSTCWHCGCDLNRCNTSKLQWKGLLFMCLLCFDMLVMGCVQGFNSDSEDDNSEDEGDHVEGMSGDEQMGEQEDFEGSDGFDEASRAPSICTAGLASTHSIALMCSSITAQQRCQCMSQVVSNASASECRLAHAVYVSVLAWHPTVIVVF